MEATPPRSGGRTGCRPHSRPALARLGDGEEDHHPDGQGFLPGRPPRNANTRAWGKASATATSFAVGGWGIGWKGRRPPPWELSGRPSRDQADFDQAMAVESIERARAVLATCTSDGLETIVDVGEISR